MNALGKALTKYQKAKKLNDADLARALRLHKSTIGLLKRGTRQPGRKVKDAFKCYALDFYPTLIKCAEGITPTPYQTAQNENLGAFRRLLKIFSFPFSRSKSKAGETAVSPGRGPDND